MINTCCFGRHKVAVDEFMGIQNRFTDLAASANKAKGVLHTQLSFM